MKYTVIGDRNDLTICIHMVEADSPKQAAKDILWGMDGETEEGEEPLTRIFAIIGGHSADCIPVFIQHMRPVTWADFEHED